MVQACSVRWMLICTACLSYPASSLVAAPVPAYSILLRSRGAAVTPEKSKNSQTGGGYIQVTQVEPNTVMILMRGAVVAASHHKEGSAALQFELNQDFDIVPAGNGLRPPRIVLSAWVIGALSSTSPEGGTAEQAAGCASVASSETPLLKACVNPHGVSAGQNLLVNDRFGPIEAAVVPGGYTLHQTFALRASQHHTCYHSGFAAADFDPDPRLDSQFNLVLKPFRAVPHRDFGFRVVLRVVEDVPPPAIVVPKDELLPAPTPEKSEPRP